MDIAPKTETITLSDGTAYTLHELSFGDLCELEEQGVDLDTAIASDGQTQNMSKVTIGWLMWMSVRQRTHKTNGGEWEPSREAFLQAMTLQDFKRHAPTIMRFLAAPFAQEEEPTKSS